MKYDKIIVELLKRHLKGEKDEIVNLADNGYAIQTDRAVYIIPKEKMVLDAGVFKEGDIDIQSIRVPVDAEVVERTNMLSKVKASEPHGRREGWNYLVCERRFRLCVGGGNGDGNRGAVAAGGLRRRNG